MDCEGKQLKKAATNVIETRPISLSMSRESTISGKVSAFRIMNTPSLFSGHFHSLDRVCSTANGQKD